MEHVQAEVAEMTLSLLKNVRKNVPRTKEYHQVRVILDTDIKNVEKEAKHIRKHPDEFFTNMVAMHHAFSITAMLTNAKR